VPSMTAKKLKMKILISSMFHVIFAHIIAALRLNIIMNMEMWLAKKETAMKKISFEGY
jgi:hypothetical protein